MENNKDGFTIIGFDLDGTLVDSAAELTASINHICALERLDPFDRAAIIPMIGKGVRHLIGSAFAARGRDNPIYIAQYLSLFKAHYAAHLGKDSALYHEAEQCLQQLRAQGRRLALITNKDRALAQKLLQQHRLDGYFAAIIGGDTAQYRKPHPAPLLKMLEMLRQSGKAEPQRALFVGDSIHDIKAARSASMPVVAVSYGYADRPAAQLGADAVIDGLDQLPALLGKIIA